MQSLLRVMLSHNYLSTCCLEQVKTVEGTTELKIPPGTQPGDVLVLSKKGAPKLNRPSIRGDHTFTVKVSIPKRIRCVTVCHRANIIVLVI